MQSPKLSFSLQPICGCRRVASLPSSSARPCARSLSPTTFPFSPPVLLHVGACALLSFRVACWARVFRVHALLGGCSEHVTVVSAVSAVTAVTGFAASAVAHPSAHQRVSHLTLNQLRSQPSRIRSCTISYDLKVARARRTTPSHQVHFLWLPRVSQGGLPRLAASLRGPSWRSMALKLCANRTLVALAGLAARPSPPNTDAAIAG